jgi:hypothetical protein
MQILAYIAAIIIALWFSFRVFWFLFQRAKRRLRQKRGFRCPKCGSENLDEYSDRESGYCLDCKHIWGVDKGTSSTEDENPT